MQGKVLDIDQITSIVAPVADEYGIGKMAIFGSYARGEATEQSDIDFHVIDRGNLRGLFGLADFELALEEKLKVPVDVIVADSTFEDVRRNILQEELVIYDSH